MPTFVPLILGVRCCLGKNVIPNHVLSLALLDHFSTQTLISFVCLFSHRAIENTEDAALLRKKKSFAIVPNIVFHADDIHPINFEGHVQEITTISYLLPGPPEL